MAWRHGITGYVTHGCRCPTCVAVYRAYQADWQRERRAGVRRTVPPDEARRHLRRLRDAGLTYAAIAAECGLTDTTLIDIDRGRYKRVRREVAEAILGVTCDATPEGYLVDATTTRRLIQAMREAGYREREIATMLGYRSQTLRFRGRRVTWRNHRRIVTLYRLLARQGYVPADTIEEVRQ